MTIFPLLQRLQHYSKPDLIDDLLAGLIVTAITAPQAMAYAYLAGLPAEIGLYSAIAALVAYSLFGSNGSLAVGPTAVISLMTVQALSSLYQPESTAYTQGAILLALTTGAILLLLRLVKFGEVVNFLSHAVVTGFISAAACLIIISQLSALSGMALTSQEQGFSKLLLLLQNLSAIHYATLLMGITAIVLLVLCKTLLPGLLQHSAVKSQWHPALVRSAPLYIVIMAITVVYLIQPQGMSLVGNIPAGIPSLPNLQFNLAQLNAIAPSALLIAMVIFIESTSVGSVVASKRRERIDPNQELIGLGVANIASGLVGGFPSAGSFARTMVNFAAGAVTTVASLVTALCLVLLLLFFTPLFYYLPKTILAAIIVVSAAQLIDLHVISKLLAFNRQDAVTFVTTFVAVLLLGVETGIVIGVVLGFALLIRAASTPHIAAVGRVGKSGHFRNIDRHAVNTSEQVLALRVDESLYFVNTRHVERYVLNKIAEQPALEHILLICSATNFIDTAGLELLEALNENLQDANIKLHLAEVKGPVMDHLAGTHFCQELTGEVFFTTDQAMRELGGV